MSLSKQLFNFSPSCIISDMLRKKNWFKNLRYYNWPRDCVPGVRKMFKLTLKILHYLLQDFLNLCLTILWTLIDFNTVYLWKYHLSFCFFAVNTIKEFLTFVRFISLPGRLFSAEINFEIQQWRGIFGTKLNISDETFYYKSR